MHERTYSLNRYECYLLRFLTDQLSRYFSGGKSSNRLLRMFLKISFRSIALQHSAITLHHIAQIVVDVQFWQGCHWVANSKRRCTTHRNTLQYTATPCSTAAPCNNTLQHNATHGDTLQLTHTIPPKLSWTRSSSRVFNTFST